MAEPGTTSLALATMLGVTIASFFSSVDAGTLVGATAGASLFVMSVRDLCIFTRIIYLLISLVMGYVGGPSLLGHIFGDNAVSAFVASACTIGVGLKIIAWVDKLDINQWIKK